MYAVSFIPRPFLYLGVLYHRLPTNHLDPPLPEVKELIYFERQHAMQQAHRPPHRRQIHARRDSSQQSPRSYRMRCTLEQPFVEEILMLPTRLSILIQDCAYPSDRLSFFWSDLDGIRWDLALSFSPVFCQQL